ncbi:MAG: hypothetical protein ACFFDT_39990 [Candidatus Hodarchaeota archaeon]
MMKSLIKYCILLLMAIVIILLCQLTYDNFILIFSTPKTLSNTEYISLAYQLRDELKKIEPQYIRKAYIRWTCEVINQANKTAEELTNPPAE